MWSPKQEAPPTYRENYPNWSVPLWVASIHPLLVTSFDGALGIYSECNFVLFNFKGLTVNTYNSANAHYVQIYRKAVKLGLVLTEVRRLTCLCAQALSFIDLNIEYENIILRNLFYYNYDWFIFNIDVKSKRVQIEQLTILTSPPPPPIITIAIIIKILEKPYSPKYSPLLTSSVAASQ